MIVLISPHAISLNRVSELSEQCSLKVLRVLGVLGFLGVEACSSSLSVSEFVFLAVSELDHLLGMTG